jgi:hypothetical protein
MRSGLVCAVMVVVACARHHDDDAPPAPPPPAAPPFTPTPGAWVPGESVPTPRAATLRGLVDRKGLVHAHSVYSHDACDGKPRDENGNIDRVCLDDMRKAICTSRMDFVFLTDHRDSFAHVSYPDTLLYDAARGDQLIQRDGAPVASWAGCPGQDAAMILAGTESGTTPVGLEHHVGANGDESSHIYGEDTPDVFQRYKDAGAVALLVHTENYNADQLTNLPIDGFEMYNLHANSFRGAGKILELLGTLSRDDVVKPQSDLFFLPVVSEDPLYIEPWGTALARGAHRVTTMGTDCHRNSFPQILPDGERVDSYRRMMGWFSNHLLVRPAADGTFGDRDLKDALRSGRLYGSFDVLGTPEAFDYFAREADAPHEMGESVSVAKGVTLHVEMPRIVRLDPAVKPPALTVRVLRAREGGWDVVKTGDSSLDVAIDQPGAYRAEIRMTPHHLEPFMGDYAELSRTGDFVWIYANPIYVTP